MSQRKYNKEELEEAVKNSLSIAEVLRHLNIIPAGGNYFTIKGILNYGILILHILQGNYGIKENMLYVILQNLCKKY